MDALLTNFHLPRTTLLLLVAAFAGSETLKRAYAHAVARALPVLLVRRRDADPLTSGRAPDQVLIGVAVVRSNPVRSCLPHPPRPSRMSTIAPEPEEQGEQPVGDVVDHAEGDHHREVAHER